MKTLKFLTVIALSSLMFACSSNSNEENKHNEASNHSTEVTDNKPIKDHLAIYDFHSEHRCVTCIAIENATKEIIHKYFQNEFDNGTITFDLYNCEAEENQKLVEEYGAFGTTLAFTVFKDGKKQDVKDLTNWAFEKIDTDDFETEMKKDIETALNKIK